ncbi:restriction endonuclease subunit S [Vibrio cyclitrophicus]
MSWPLVKLGEVAPSKALKNPVVVDDDNVWQLNLDMVESGSGRILKKLKAPLSEAGSSTHWFDDRHILYSKLRPYLNKVVLPDEEGLATTELVPMLPDPKRLDRRYLVHYLRSKQFVSWISDQVAGAKMPRVSMKVFWDHEIPLPPVEEQKRIAAILDKADAIRQKRKQAIDLADEFLRSVFLDMFGDPVKNPKGWEIKRLEELISEGDKLNYGVVQPGDDDENGVPLVRSGDLRDSGTPLSLVRRVSLSVDEKHRKSRLKGNEILIACVGSIGKVGWVNESMVGWNIARAVTRIPLKDSVNREYVFRYLQSPVIQGYFQKETRAVAQPTLNVGLISKTPIALPPQEQQNEFLSVHNKVSRFKQNAIDKNKHLDEMFKALSQKAFSGQL